MWWAALGLLVLNDHLLKGAGLLPGWLTGKLSDVAGMIVAPLLLCALAGVRRRWARLSCFAAVALVFGAINVSPAAADALVALLSRLGVTWRVVVDPTDLLALAAMPLAWRVLQRPPKGRAVRRPRIAAFAVVVGSLACLASGEPDEWSTRAYVVNATGAPIDLRVRLYDGLVDCGVALAVPARAIDPDAFAEGTTFALDNGQVLSLEPDDIGLWLSDHGYDAYGAPGESANDCQVMLLQTDAMPDFLVVWRTDVPYLTVPKNCQDDACGGALKEGRIDIQGAPRHLVVSHGAHLVVEAVEDPGPSSCPAQAPSFDWSFEPEGQWNLSAVEQLTHDCLQLTLAYDELPGGAPPELFALCVPGEAFPFEVGAAVLFGDATEHLAISGQDGAMLVVKRAQEQVTELGGTLEPIGCAGDRSSCGAFVRPANVVLGQGGYEVRVEPGGKRDLADGRRLYVGRSEVVSAAPWGCPEGEDQLGARVDYALVRWGESK